ncbi:hypothetical protein KUD11_13430 [Roseovarius sp. LXJ103]|uniref:hypothetical protein n=1 Tax=Roseovarius carneus TaxID=2853164 RepID=UPI0011B2030D|nr:hypothetical protein [Roseovarius carneus]MBZ8119645.1 hypothetical protein [Roseovarius carneus]
MARVEMARDALRAQTCVVTNADAALTAAGFADAGERAAVVEALLGSNEAVQAGDGLMLRSAVCQGGPEPTRHNRFLAAIASDGTCARSTEGLASVMGAYGVNPNEMALLADEMARHDELSVSADRIEVTAEFCDRAKELAATIIPETRAGFVAFMAGNECRVGVRDKDLLVSQAGLDPARTDVVIEALVSEGEVIYYGYEKTLILVWGPCS